MCRHDSGRPEHAAAAGTRARHQRHLGQLHPCRAHRLRPRLLGARAVEPQAQAAQPVIILTPIYSCFIRLFNYYVMIVYMRASI